MVLGILSDSHGRIHLVERALAIFDQHGVDGIVHCGDIGGLEVLEVFSGRPFWFVWGNTDSPRQSWRAAVRSFGAYWPESIPVVIEADSQHIAVFHGSEREFITACHNNDYDYILHGHTHRASDHRQGRTRIINPGALYRAPSKTVAILDTQTDQLQYCTVTG